MDLKEFVQKTLEALDTVSTLIGVVVGFIVGVTTRAMGSYLGTRLTDHRRTRQAAKQVKQDFLAIKKQMPALVAEIKADLAGEGHNHIREFFVLPRKSVCLGGSEKPRFAYYEDEHENLRGKLDILESNGYIIDVTPGNAPIYRMTEEFVNLVRRFG